MEEQTFSRRKVRDQRPLLRVAVRMAYLYWAEEESRRHRGRPLTTAELERVVRHYSGEV